MVSYSLLWHTKCFHHSEAREKWMSPYQTKGLQIQTLPSIADMTLFASNEQWLPPPHTPAVKSHTGMDILITHKWGNLELMFP